MTRTKVIVWGAGSLGGACIRELSRLPGMELVGVLVFNPAKDGRDAGELVGIDPLGLRATADKQKIFSLDADCVLHCARAEADHTLYDADVIRLLESRKNVISAATYHYAPLHGKAYAQRLEEACRKGNASLHGTGIHPGFFLERLGVAATGLSNRITQITAREVTDCSRVQSRAFMEAFGFGADATAFDPEGPVARLTDRYFHESLSFLTAKVFGRAPDRIEKTSSFGLTAVDTEIVSMTIRAGKVASIQYVFSAWLDAAARVRLEQHWYTSDALKSVPEADSPHYWDLEVEGEPCSLRLRMDAFASIRSKTQGIAGDPTMLTFYATAVPMIQAIPAVCSAEPGIVYQTAFAHHRPDLGWHRPD